MAPLPLVQFKAGRCEIDEKSKPWKVKPDSTPGFIYLYREDELAHFCWRPRNTSPDDAGDDALDLIMLPGDGHFEPYHPSTNTINGRIYQLGFESSSTKHFFWLQSSSQHPDGRPSSWTDQDHSLGRIVSEILNGEEVDALQVYQRAGNGLRSRRDEDDDEDDDGDDTEMKEAGDDNDGHPGAGGAGAGATGGSVTEEGEGSRQGGEDGARAVLRRPVPGEHSSQVDAQAAVANLLRSLQNNPNLTGDIHSQSSEKHFFTTLPELLKSESTLQAINSASEKSLDNLLLELPYSLIFQEHSSTNSSAHNVSSEEFQNDLRGLTHEGKKFIVGRVLRSPQFLQSLSNLTAALREGGLPMICDALKVRVRNGGFVTNAAIPLTGGQAVSTFLTAFKDDVSDRTQGEHVNLEEAIEEF